MAGNDELKIVVRAAVKDAVRDLGAVETKIDGVANRAQSFAQRAGRVGQSLTRGVTLPLAGAGAAAVKFAADIEKQRTAFGVLLGDVERGAKLFEQLKTFSASTPLQLDDINQASQTLLAFGTAAENVVDQIRMIGDVAQGDAEKLGRLSQAFGRVQAKGKASLEEINIFLEAGVPLIAQWSEQFGVAESEVFDMISAGEIGFADMQSALESMTGTGGQFEGMLERMSETTSGKLSTAIDNLKLAAAELGKELLPMVNDLLDNATDLAQRFGELDDGTKKLILGVGGLAAASGPAIRGIAGISRAVGFLAANPMTAAIAGATALAAGLAKLVIDWRAHRDLLRENARRGAENNDVLRATKIELNEVAEATARSTEEQIKRLETMIAEQEVLGEYTEFELANFKREQEELEKITSGQGRRNAVQADFDRLAVVRETIAEIETELAKRERAIELIEEQKRAAEERRDAEREAVDVGGGPPEDAVKSWREWFEDVTGIAATSGEQAAGDFIDELERQLANDQAVADALGETFDLEAALRSQQAELRATIAELLDIPPGEIDEPFEIADESISGLIERIVELEAMIASLSGEGGGLEDELGGVIDRVTGEVEEGVAQVEQWRESWQGAAGAVRDYEDAYDGAHTNTRQFAEEVKRLREEAEASRDAIRAQNEELAIAIGESAAREVNKALSLEDISFNDIQEAWRSIGKTTVSTVVDMYAPGLGQLAGELFSIVKNLQDRLLGWAEEKLGVSLGIVVDDVDVGWAHKIVEAEEDLAEKRLEVIRDQLEREREVRDEHIRLLDRQFSQEFEVLRDQWERNLISTAEFEAGMADLNAEYEAEREAAEAPVEELEDEQADIEAQREALQDAKDEKLSDLAQAALALEQELADMTGWQKFWTNRDSEIERELAVLDRRRRAVEAATTIEEVRAAKYGASFETSGPQLLLVGDNPGGREHVNVEPLNSAGGSGGRGVTIVVSGDVYGVDDLYARLEAAGRQLSRRGRVA